MVAPSRQSSFNSLASGRCSLWDVEEVGYILAPHLFLADHVGSLDLVRTIGACMWIFGGCFVFPGLGRNGLGGAVLTTDEMGWGCEFWTGRINIADRVGGCFVRDASGTRHDWESRFPSPT